MSLKEHKYLLPSALVVVATVIVVSGIQSAHAVNDTLISKALQLNRLRVNFADVTASANVADPGNVCNGLAKRVVVLSEPAASEINSIVTKARSAFSGPGISQIGIVAVRAEKNGVQVSNGDIAVPDTDLTDTTYIENRVPNSGEYAFYDENDPWDVVAYFCGKDTSGNPVSLSTLNHGNVDFYISTTK